MPPSGTGLADPARTAAMKRGARRQLAFFRASLTSDGRFDVLDLDGRPIPGQPQELITTTRMAHSYALGQLAGAPDCAEVVSAGIDALLDRHRDPAHGGYVWSFGPDGPLAGEKLAYGHMFVLLAAASGMAAGHPRAGALLDDISDVIDRHFWDEDAGLMREEFHRDWSRLSGYRGMNANMHGVEAHLSAYEATGDRVFLDRAGRILGFFTGRMAPAHGDRLPEHYTENWEVDRAYSGDPMFRPAGTTPGHSFELGRLLIQHWDLSGRPATDAPALGRRLIARALADAWLPEGGVAYTLDFDGKVAVRNRYWWPVTEAIGAVAALMKLGPGPEDAAWYDRLWDVAERLFIDAARGGWFPEVDAAGRPDATQFTGKPDIYHALQAELYPLCPAPSGYYEGVKGLLAA
ncbi:AGE family epimerase/isomerase [Acidimangrovimonas sediminis]|uniref:AGE family epimerase/isomerase n=1 Tax=Acidimangrovimonas sediminis TaxID=2056283 RepID=UPI001E59453E|nr:AGE family epimerase/isomerase [Acidimangrovimonas sediminis]